MTDTKEIEKLALTYQQEHKIAYPVVDFLDGKQLDIGINWGCKGAVSIEDAQNFLNELSQAIAYAKYLKDKKEKQVTK